MVESGREQRLPASVVPPPPSRLESKFVELPLGVMGSWELQSQPSGSSQKRGGNWSFLNCHIAPVQTELGWPSRNECFVTYFNSVEKREKQPSHMTTARLYSCEHLPYLCWTLFLFCKE